MGESYLRRKLFSKIKRIQSSQSSMLRSSLSNNNNNTNEQVDLENNEIFLSNSKIDRQAVNHSNSMPQLQERRQSKLMTAIEMIRSEQANVNVSDDLIGGRQQQEEEEEEAGQEDDNNNVVDNNHEMVVEIDRELTNDRLAGQQQRLETSPIDDDDNNFSQQQEQQKTKNCEEEKFNLRSENEGVRMGQKSRSASSGKLRTASKAILFFRRAASVLKTSTSSTTNSFPSTSSATLFEHHLNGLPFQRQSTNDSSTQSQNSSSHCSFGNIKQLQPKAAQQNESSSSVLIENNQQQAPCKFVVPKLNSLKMPLVCLIKSIDGELMREVFVHRYELGQHLIESLKVSLGLEDCKFFGLKLAKSLDDQEDLRNPWLDLNESICKQIKQLSGKGCLLAGINSASSYSNNNNNNCSTTSYQNNISHNNTSSSSNCSLRSIDFYLRIKFYPPNLTRVQDSFLRHYLWLQLRRDLCLGKLISSMNNLTLLMACILQYEFGDFKQEHVERIQPLNILPNQDLIEEQAIELWRYKLMGCRRHQAQMKFLRASVILETYGFDYYPVRDHQLQRAYLLGFNYAGIKTIRNGRIVHHLRWHSLSKICYERRMIIFHQYPTENSKRKQILGFKCLSNDDCQNLYMRLLEQKYFFTVDLAYFDKSVRRPSCLYSSRSLNDNNIPSDQPGHNRAAPFSDNISNPWPQEAPAGAVNSTQVHGSQQRPEVGQHGSSCAAQGTRLRQQLNNLHSSSSQNSFDLPEEANCGKVSPVYRRSNELFNDNLVENNIQTDEELYTMNEAWLKRRREREEGEQHRFLHRSATQHSSLDNNNNNNDFNDNNYGSNYHDHYNYYNFNDEVLEQHCQTLTSDMAEKENGRDWTKKVFKSCQDSGLSGLVESVLGQTNFKSLHKSAASGSGRLDNNGKTPLLMNKQEDDYDADADDDPPASYREGAQKNSTRPKEASHT